MYTTAEILTLAKAYAAHYGCSLWEAARDVFSASNPATFMKMSQGAGCTVRNLEKASRYFNERWPAEATWPLSRRLELPPYEEVRYAAAR